MIRIELAASTLALGDHAKGKAVWNAAGSKHPRKIEVKFRRRIEGKKSEESVIDVATEERTEGRSEIVVPFDFEIAIDYPVSYDGKLFRIVWEVVARADMPFATDEVDTKVIVVKPPVWTAEQFRQWLEHMDDDDEEDEEEEEAADEDETVR